MHAHDPEQLTEQQRRWAERANALHARLQAMLMAVATSEEPLMATLGADDELCSLAKQLTYANLRLWAATAGPLRRVLICAAEISRLLGQSCSAATLGNVIINARSATTALASMTDMQRRTMLAIPAVALAFDIAHDCEAEFDTGQQWRRWVARAHPDLQERRYGFRFDNDNHPESGLFQPSR